jgi:radical SAM superfamily enzyme YgiQ (UPF0313 family)
MGQDAVVGASLSPATMIVLDGEGPRLYLGNDLGAVPLGLLELELLLALSEAGNRPVAVVAADVAAAASRTVEDLGPIIATLETAGLLSGGARAASTAPPAPAPADSAGVDAADQLVAVVPRVLRPASSGFEMLDGEARVLLTLAPREVMALSPFGRPLAMSAAFTSHRSMLGDAALDAVEFEALVKRGLGAQLLMPARGPQRWEGRAVAEYRAAARRFKVIERALADGVERHEQAVAARVASSGVTLVPVVPVQHQTMIPPLALGMVIAYAKAHDGGVLRHHYNFVPDWHTPPERRERHGETDGIYLFSNYVWSHEQNLAACAEIKARSPRSIMVHGGPDTPRYPGDVEDYFRAHRYVDIAVHGEGEVTCAEMLMALRGCFDDSGHIDLSVLADVPGLSFRGVDGVVRTADRERLTDLDVIPSPYTTGLFEAYGVGETAIAIIETNRGCPYGCTFCDWGSATLSRIRKFELDRVFNELEWVARNHVERVFVADANFGILERDVQFAERIAELKREYGYPKVFATNYAKNTVKHLRRIVEVLVDAEILTEGLLSLQTMDDDTLTAVKRHNIKVEKYDALAKEFRKGHLPLFVDLMLGLPGSTVESFREDLQQVIDREVTAKIFQTEVLVNSPMNEPGYREAHQIQSENVGGGWYRTRARDGAQKGRALVVATSSFTRSEYDEMLTLRRVFRLLENFGVLRHVSRFVRQEAGVREVDFFDQIRLAATNKPDTWPLLAFTIACVPEIMVPPASWRLFIDEVHGFLVEHIGLADDSALAAVLAVQHALLPAQERTFPHRLELPHDYAAWHAAMLEAKDGGQRDVWTDLVPRLRSFAPGELVVEDPNQVCQRGLGFRNEDDFTGDWELASPVSRVMPALHLAGA